jgi:hypothetical protein
MRLMMTWTMIVHFRIGNSDEIVTRFNFDHRRNVGHSWSLEWISKRYSDSTVQSSRELLKAQLMTGQHTLTKQQFLDVVARYGWKSQLPADILKPDKRDVDI